MPVNDSGNDPVNDNLPATPVPPTRAERKRRRFINRRNAVITGVALGVAIFAIIIVSLLLYRLGFVDRYLVSQIKDDFSKYGIRAEIKTFHASLPPSTVDMQGFELFDALSGEKLGKIDRMVAAIRIQDLYALKLTRKVDLRDLK